jgi:hypothetical protein
MNVVIEAEAAQFPEKEYINGIAVAVCMYYKMLAFFRPMTSSVSSERYNHRTLFLIIIYWPVYPRMPLKNPNWAFMF